MELIRALLRFLETGIKPNFKTYPELEGHPSLKIRLQAHTSQATGVEDAGNKTDNSASPDPESQTGESSPETEKEEKQSQSKDEWQIPKRKKRKSKKSTSDKKKKEKEVKKPQNLQPFERPSVQTKAKQPTPSPSTGEWSAFKIPKLPHKPVKRKNKFIRANY